MTAPTAYPLAWPPGVPRAGRPIASAFKVTLAQAMNDLGHSLMLFGKDTGKPVTGVVISSNVTLGAGSPKDAGVAVYFDWDGAQRAIAVDRYAKVHENVRAIWAVLEARRTEMRHGGLTIVRAAFAGFTALPAPESARPWRTVLGFPADARPDAQSIRESYRQRAVGAHPDTGGSDAAMAALNAARAAALAEIEGRAA